MVMVKAEALEALFKKQALPLDELLHLTVSLSLHL
jgi:hypothetical protein